jgi:hypothetical protein
MIKGGQRANFKDLRPLNDIRYAYQNLWIQHYSLSKKVKTHV